MPRGDGTGPMGMGPMTGRGLGICAGIYTGIAALRCINRGTGYGMGFGRGRGFGRMSYTAYGGAFKSAEDEKEYLSNQAELLENQLHQVEKRLKDINGDVE
ncbi:MAG: hypothetical protein APF77_00810 [Clostridia bacterium BRH_c25]|nr:MAG: hypothetical protein APF77_00810 [Clostridia bacterium BRH_c25]